MQAYELTIDAKVKPNPFDTVSEVQRLRKS